MLEMSTKQNYQQTFQFQGTRILKQNSSVVNFSANLNFKSAFWKIELEPESRCLTVFYVNDKLYRYKRLVLGLKPAQGELNVALHQIFNHIDDVYLIRDDLVAANTQETQDIAVGG